MKIAFASCAKIQDFPEQPAWKNIEDHNPDLLLLLGDNVYAPNKGWNHDALEKRYIEQHEEPHFKSLISRVPFKAIWDDHDFGPNNSKGAEVDDEKRNRSRELFHRYMDSSTNLPEAYYAFDAKDIDPNITESIRFIMLDVRYYREDSDEAGASPIGEKQYEWLESELTNSADVTIVCSGTCLTQHKLQDEYLEKYSDFYHNRFLPLLNNARNLIVLTGDVHSNHIVDHGLFAEFVSSGVSRGGLFSRKIRNNFGMLSISDSRIEIALEGRREKDQQSATIDPSTWQLSIR